MAERLGGALRAMFTLLVVLAGIGFVGNIVVGDPSDASRQEASAPEPTAAPTATPVPTKTPEQLSAEAEYLDPRRLAAAPDSYLGQNIYVQGKANSVNQQGDYTWVQFLAEVRDRSITESIVVELRPRNLDVLREECYRFFGVVAGTTDTKVVLTGASSESALVEAYAVEPSPRGGFSGCEAP